MARPRLISADAILEAGLAIGLADLSVSAVAERLGVTRTAIYRHGPGRAALETLVGEHLLGQVEPPPDRQQPLDAYLREFGWWLRDISRSTPGLADYMVHLFPHSPASGRLMEHAVTVTVGHGWSPAAALPFFEGADDDVRFEWYLRAVVAGALAVAPDLGRHPNRPG